MFKQKKACSVSFSPKSLHHTKNGAKDKEQQKKVTPPFSTSKTKNGMFMARRSRASTFIVAKEIEDKSHFHIEETFTQIAIFSNLLSVQEELFINDQQQNEYLVYYFMTAFI